MQLEHLRDARGEALGARGRSVADPGALSGQAPPNEVTGEVISRGRALLALGVFGRWRVRFSRRELSSLRDIQRELDAPERGAS